MRLGTPIWVRTAATTLLFAMLYYFAGYRVVYFIVMHNAKSDAALAIKYNTKAIQTMALTFVEYNSIKWSETGKEFSYNGQLYDVVNVSKANNNYTLQVYADKNETRWAKALNDFVKQIFPSSHSNDGMKTAEGLASALQKEYSPLNPLKLILPENFQKIYFPSNRLLLSVNCNSNIWHPPASC